MNYILLLWHCW